MIKDQWAVNKKYFEEDQNMNKALTERFLQLMPPAQRQEYKDILVGDPNRRFETTFAYFYDNPEQTDASEDNLNQQGQETATQATQCQVRFQSNPTHRNSIRLHIKTP